MATANGSAAAGGRDDEAAGKVRVDCYLPSPLLVELNQFMIRLNPLKPNRSSAIAELLRRGLEAPDASRRPA